MATEKAPVALTGGAGFEFDDCVAARFMLDLLKARCSLGAEYRSVATTRYATTSCRPWCASVRT